MKSIIIILLSLFLCFHIGKAETKIDSLPVFTSDFEVLSLYPNPVVNGNLTISVYLPDNLFLYYTIYNSQGQKISTQVAGTNHFQLIKGFHDIEINLSNLSLTAGIYFISFSKGNGQDYCFLKKENQLTGATNFKQGELFSEKLKFQSFLKFIVQNK